MSQATAPGSEKPSALTTILRWFDTEAGLDISREGRKDEVDWIRIAPFITLHAGCFGIIWVGWSWTALGVAAGLHVIRMFAITKHSTAMPPI